MLYKVSTLFAYCFLKLFFDLKVEGSDAFPADQPFILASNHCSHLDPPVLASTCPKPVAFLAKQELFGNKLLSLYLNDVGVIPVRRGKSEIKIIRLALKTLKTRALLIFPQGTRNRAFEEANLGVGFLCKKAKVPVVAARIRGTDKVLPKGAKFFRRGKIKVAFARLDNITSEDDYSAITRKVMRAIENL